MYQKSARVAFVAACALLVNLAVALPASAKPYKPGGAQKEPTVAGYSMAPKDAPKSQTGSPFTAPAPVWPTPSKKDVAMPGAKERQLGLDGPVQVSGLPLQVQALDTSAAPVTVESFDRATTVSQGVDGILMRLSRATPGRFQVGVDYNSFRWAYGGDWASRLSLYVDGKKVPSVNNHAKGTVEATVQIGSDTMVALAAAAEGSGGDFKATSLSPSATWSAGGNSGDFSWSYPLRLPPALNGPAPKVDFNYSSASADGRMASTNNQASPIGEGFEFNPGSIERRYNSCAEDMGSGANNSEKTGDQCWDTDNASLSLSGHAGELIKDGTNSNLWHLRSDDGTRIERKTGGPNSDNDGEWWIVTTTDGTEYWFGGRSGSNAVLTSPVYGNHSGEPCHATAFADSYCSQGYRWNLDHVVDLNGNSMSLTYVKETNKYGRNNKREDDTVYDRDGYLSKIEYGAHNGVAGSAPMRVLFGVSDRCLSSCTTKDAVHWPDVPWDQECTADTCNWNQLAPSFWSSKRLSSVKTQVWGGLDYRDVEQWTLTHSFPSSDQPTLWLEKIAHIGYVGGTLSVPDITFVGVAMPNRVDTSNDQYPAMNRYRMKTINSETGGKLDLTYTAPDCVSGTRVPDKNNLQNNTLRCYPVKWQPEGQTSPIDDFFHRYLVTDVVEAELGGWSSRVLTHYDYVGDPAWHYTDDDGFIKKDFKTYSVWRGYGTVRVTKGDPGEQTVEEKRYFRGMHGDKLPSGTRSVQLPAVGVGNVPAMNDEDAFSGMLRESVTLNGPGGAEVSATVEEPWQSNATASRTINSFTVNARFTGTKVKHARTVLDGGRGYRTSTQRTTFDAYGMPIETEDLGENGKANDESCSLMDYARNSGEWLMEKASRERKFSVDCTKAKAGGLTDDDVVSDEKTSYDGLAWGVAPTKGNATKVEKLKAYNNGSSTYVTESINAYDSYGRLLEATDVRGAKTVKEYTPLTGGPVTSIKETSPLGWVKTTSYEPAWNLQLTTTDANGRKLDFAYDPMGRLTQVWFAGRDKGTQTPNIVYSYLIRNNAPTVVTTKRLNATGGYITSYKLYDNLLRERQTQDPDGAGGTGAVVTETFYDSAGNTFKTHEQYLAPVAPSVNLFVATGNIPRLKVRRFDGAGREIAEIDMVDGPPASPGGTEKWRTTTTYGGDHDDVTPPAGGTKTSTYTDVFGNTAEVRQYKPGGYDKTTYTYNRKDELTELTDSTGRKWQYTYDLGGKQTKIVDPDKGTIENTYNDAGDLLTSKDSRGTTLAYGYDGIGRKTALRQGSDTGPLLSEWVYDRLSNGVDVKGQLVKSVRYNGTDQYIKEHMGYTTDYKVSSVKYTVDSDETGLGGTYTYVYTYNQDGSPATIRLPAAGDLGLETLTFDYNAQGKPTTLSTSLGGTIVIGTDYTSYNELGAVHLKNNAGAQADVVRTYNSQTRRLEQIWTTRATSPTTVSDVRYEYDGAGNVTKISDLTAADYQCFTTDTLRRLTEAWTPSNGDCAPAPTAAALGGPAKYWNTYTYDSSGTRTKLVEHATTAGDRTTNYTVPAAGHKMTGTSTSDNAGTRTTSYTYDTVGNTKTRPTATSGTQTLTWDAEGHLATAADLTGTTEYLYDIDGTRLIRRDPAGKTLYLPWQELRYKSSNGAKSGIRYYTHADQAVATRSSAGVVWLMGDHHGTSQIAVNAVGQGVATRRETPFGEQRGGTGTWPSTMDRGFVGGTKDNTGLTHLGAREYDPLIGRFISVDPVMDNKDPQQMHGYSYANNAPVTADDSDGNWPNWLDKAAKAVTNTVATAVTNVASNVSNIAKDAGKAFTSGVGAVGKWVVDNSGTISAVLGVAAIVCMIPPLTVAAPFLGAASAAFGAIDTVKSCATGQAIDCGLGIAGMIPGGRAVVGGIKGVRAAKKALDATEEAYKAAKKLRGAAKATKRELDAMRGQMRRMGEDLDSARDSLRNTLQPWKEPYRPTILEVENIGWETYKAASTNNYDKYKNMSRTSTVASVIRPSINWAKMRMLAFM